MQKKMDEAPRMRLGARIILEPLFHARNEQQTCDWPARCHAASQLCAAEKAPGGTERLLPAVASSSAVFVTGEGNSGVQSRPFTSLKSGPTPVNTGQNPHANDESAKRPRPEAVQALWPTFGSQQPLKHCLILIAVRMSEPEPTGVFSASIPRFVELNLRNEPF